MEILFLWIFLSIAVGFFSSSRGHSFIAGFLFSMILSPLVAGIIVAVRKPNVSKLAERAIDAGEMKKCPQCAELIKAEAVVCRYCGVKLEIEKREIF